MWETNVRIKEAGDIKKDSQGNNTYSYPGSFREVSPVCVDIVIQLRPSLDTCISQ